AGREIELRHAGRDAQWTQEAQVLLHHVYGGGRRGHAPVREEHVEPLPAVGRAEADAQPGAGGGGEYAALEQPLSIDGGGNAAQAHAPTDPAELAHDLPGARGPPDEPPPAPL